MPISNYPNGFANGVNIRGIPLLNTYPGQVFWVDDSGSNGNKGTFDRPFATIDYAIGKCTSGRGDVILVKAGHAETLTAQIDADVAGVKIIGLGGVGDMPTLTTATAIDMIDVSADNITIANIEFAVPGIDAVTADINVDAAGCEIIGTKHHGSTTAKNKVDIITLTANANDCLIDGVRIYNTTVEVVGGIVFEGACSRVEVRNCMVQDAVGFTDGCISDEAIALQLYIHDNIFSNAKAGTVVMNWVTNSTGICSKNFINGRHTTIQSNVVAGTGMNFHEQYGVEQAAVNGLLMPVVDAE